MTITETLRSVHLPVSAVVPTCVTTVFFRRGLGTGNAFADGCRLHDQLAAGGSHPVVGAICHECRKRGARVVRAERSLASWCDTPSGRADIVATGPGVIGVVELKVVAQLPDEPRSRDALQLGGYVALAAHWSNQLQRAWALLAYVDLDAGRLRLFEFRGRELRELVRASREVLEAA